MALSEVRMQACEQGMCSWFSQSCVNCHDAAFRYHGLMQLSAARPSCWSRREAAAERMWPQVVHVHGHIQLIGSLCWARMSPRKVCSLHCYDADSVAGKDLPAEEAWICSMGVFTLYDSAYLNCKGGCRARSVSETACKSGGPEWSKYE